MQSPLQHTPVPKDVEVQASPSRQAAVRPEALVALEEPGKLEVPEVPEVITEPEVEPPAGPEVSFSPTGWSQQAVAQSQTTMESWRILAC